jgi:hypothetical protein
MTTYRHRPDECEAVQWTDANAAELEAFAGSRFMTIDPEDRTDDPDATAAILSSPHSTWALLLPGDWVIRRGDSLTLLPNDEFTDLYEPAPAVAAPAKTALREQLRRALAEADGFNYEGLEPHDYQRHVDAVMAVLRGLTLRELELLHRPNTPPSRPEPHRMAAVELLRRTESYLSALHGSVARHDNLAANLGCAGCELRDQVGAELRRMADEERTP